MREPSITISGVSLNTAQAMTLRVAVGLFLIDLEAGAVGGELDALYRARLLEISKLMMRSPQ